MGDGPAIHKRMANWKRGTLERVEDGEHEVLLESAAVADPLFDKITNLFLSGGHG